MAVPSFIYKHAATALIAITLAGSAWGLVKWHASTHYKKGVAAEKAAQAARDALVDPIQVNLENDLDEAKDVRNETTREIRTEVRTGISEITLTRATEEAKQTGRELGRAETLASIRAKGGCLTVEFDSSDQLLLDWQDQQRDIFGDVVGSDRTSEADTVRETGREPTLSGAPGSYPKVAD